MYVSIDGERTCFPLYKMVRELSRRARTNSDIIRFNGLELEKQLNYFKTKIEDADKMIKASKQMSSSRVSEFSAVESYSRDCGIVSGQGMIFHHRYFISEGGIYLEASFNNGDLILMPMSGARNQVHVYRRQFFPDCGTRRNLVNGNVNLAHWAGMEGCCSRRDPEKYSFEVQRIVPCLYINISSEEVDRASMDLLKKSAA